MKSEVVEVIMRDGPCKCGCHGTDPQHARVFKRALLDVKETTEIVGQVDEGPIRLVTARAKIKVPWGYQNVERRALSYAGHTTTRGWYKSNT